MKVKDTSMASKQVREVWKCNLLQELDSISELCQSFHYVFIDTEFPGFLQSPPHDASEQERYRALKFNVDNLKMVQLGITLSDRPKTDLHSWQLNFSEFDPNVDACSKSSVEFLMKSGIDFDRNRKEGVSASLLSKLLQEKLISGCEGSKWITFHRLYDLAYLRKMTYQIPLPSNLSGFLELVWKLFGKVYDVKYMAKSCTGCFAEVGVVKLSRMLEINWEGSSHQGGHNSLLTAMVFWEMKRTFDDFDEDEHVGMLCGVEEFARAMMMSPAQSDVACYYSYYAVPVGYYPANCGYWLVPVPFYVLA